MKHLQKLGYALIGSALTATIMLAAPVIAAQIQTITASINTVNIALDGKQVAAQGENYTLDNGTEVPYSLSYKGTTYLPIRKVGELIGKEIYWDAKTGTAGVGVNSEGGKESTPETPPTGPVDPNHVPDITANDLKAMFKFDQMNQVNGPYGVFKADDCDFQYCGERSIDDFIKYWSALSETDVKAAVTTFAKDFYSSEYKGNRNIWVSLSGKSETGTSLLFVRIDYNSMDGAGTSVFRFNRWQTD